MLLYHGGPRKQTHQKLDIDSPGSFWFGGVAQFIILSWPLCYDPANACFIAWPLLPKSSKFNLLQKAKLGTEADTHTHTHTHRVSSQMSINQKMRKGDSQVRRADLTRQHLPDPCSETWYFGKSSHFGYWQ